MKITQTPTRRISIEDAIRYAEAVEHYDRCEKAYKEARDAKPYDRMLDELTWNALCHAEIKLFEAS